MSWALGNAELWNRSFHEADNVPSGLVTSPGQKVLKTNLLLGQTMDVGVTRKIRFSR